MQNLRIKNYSIGEGSPLTLICGPCVIESEEHTLEVAGAIKEILQPLGVNIIFKASYDKANRSSIDSFRGPGIEKGLEILCRVQTELSLPVTTDIHSQEEAVYAGKVVDLIQVPAFLCRQTDILIKAAKSNAAVSVKKGQFMSPWDMKNVVEKLTACGKKEILLIDRGTTFGYNNLVSDMRAIPVMKSFGYPVCFDATHSVQLPGGQGASSGGQREFIPALANAAVAAGANCIFMEVHPEPEKAKSDSASVLPLDQLQMVVQQLTKIYEAVNS